MMQILGEVLSFHSSYHRHWLPRCTMVPPELHCRMQALPLMGQRQIYIVEKLGKNRSDRIRMIQATPFDLARCQDR